MPESWQLLLWLLLGYAGDMDEELTNDLLDDMDYHFNKVKCRKIEMMMPQLMKMVESEMEGMR